MNFTKSQLFLVKPSVSDKYRKQNGKITNIKKANRMIGFK